MEGSWNLAGVMALALATLETPVLARADEIGARAWRRWNTRCKRRSRRWTANSSVGGWRCRQGAGRHGGGLSRLWWGRSFLEGQHRSIAWWIFTMANWCVMKGYPKKQMAQLVRIETRQALCKSQQTRASSG